jgi:trk system potassium uptake protein TrkA
VKIVIIGAGSVGYELARTISRREHDVVLVERDAELLAKVSEQLDCRFVTGNGAGPAVLQDVGMEDCDLFAAVTNRDEINVMACLTAHALGARFKVARVREEDYYQDHRLVLDGIDLAINPDHEAVTSIREVLFQTGAKEIHDFAGGKVRIVGAHVEPGSRVAGRTLLEINRDLGERIALVTTIVRGEETLIPRGDTVIREGDQVYLAGQRRTVDRSLLYFGAVGRRLERVMIVGANAMGRELARDLVGAGVRVKLIDPDEDRCRRAAEQLKNALVLHGTGTDAELLDAEGVAEMDGFVAVSGEEETNIIACLLARRHGAGKTVCLVDRTDYVPLMSAMGVDAAVSPRLSTSVRIARFVKKGAVISSETVGFTGAEIMQLRVGRDCPWSGRSLGELDFPRDAVMAAVIKQGRVVTPRGDTSLATGDDVVVFALPGAEEKVAAFFAGGTS